MPAREHELLPQLEVAFSLMSLVNRGSVLSRHLSQEMSDWELKNEF